MKHSPPPKGQIEHRRLSKLMAKSQRSSIMLPKTTSRTLSPGLHPNSLSRSGPSRPWKSDLGQAWVQVDPVSAVQSHSGRETGSRSNLQDMFLSLLSAECFTGLPTFHRDSTQIFADERTTGISADQRASASSAFHSPRAPLHIHARGVVGGA